MTTGPLPTIVTTEMNLSRDHRRAVGDCARVVRLRSPRTILGTRNFSVLPRATSTGCSPATY